MVILDEIPKGATGKLQRIGLAEKLGLGALKVCIYGAGAIGGLLAARLAKAGAAEVGLVARGPHLAAMQTDGLTLVDGDERFTVPVAASADPAELGVQDYVIVTLEGASGAGRGGQDAAAARPRDGGRHGGQRRALVVFSWAGRAACRRAAAERRSG